MIFFRFIQYIVGPVEIPFINRQKINLINSKLCS
jgi:hypothetical protein